MEPATRLVRSLKRSKRGVPRLALILASVGLVACLAMPVSGSNLVPNIGFTHPYSGKALFAGSRYVSVCGSGWVHTPVSTVNLTTGVLEFEQQSFASSRGCTTSPGYTIANGSSSVAIVTSAIPFSAGPHTVITGVTVDWAIEISNVTKIAATPPA